MKTQYKRIAAQLINKLDLEYEMDEDREATLAKALEKLYEDAWREGYDVAVKGRED